jgi:very-short-patch-repair endonuclease
MSARLVVELDGSQHAGQVADDRQRERYLREEGYEVLRFWNNAVWENLDGVLMAIVLALEGRTVSP